MHRDELLSFLDDYFQVASFQDYAPNGLQVEGKPNIQRIICAVTASLAAINAAIDAQADALLVHHGMFWKNEMPQITGWKKQRIQKLLQHDINLIAYHLPLDAHKELGNNAQWADKMDWILDSSDNGLLCFGHIRQPETLEDLTQKLTRVLQRIPTVIGQPEKNIEKIAWCSGAGQSFFQAAAEQCVDAFITGEASEAQYHLAHETQTVFISAGHHATERFGIQALADFIQQKWNIETRFFDEANPF